MPEDIVHVVQKGETKLTDAKNQQGNTNTFLGKQLGKEIYFRHLDKQDLFLEEM